MRREVFMFAAPLFDLSGYNTALVIFNDLVAKGLTCCVSGVVADTPSVNWGAEEGVVYHLCRMLQRPLLLLQCVHHTEVCTTAPAPTLVPAPESAPEPAPVPTPAPADALEPQHSPELEPEYSQELVVKRVKAALGRLAGRTSSSPTDLVVKLWQSNFNSFKGDIDRVLNEDNNNEEEDIMFRVFDWEEYEDQPDVIEAAGAALAWARHAKKNLQFSRGDYLY